MICRTACMLLPVSLSVVAIIGIVSIGAIFSAGPRPSDCQISAFLTRNGDKTCMYGVEAKYDLSSQQGTRIETYRCIILEESNGTETCLPRYKIGDKDTCLASKRPCQGIRFQDGRTGLTRSRMATTLFVLIPIAILGTPLTFLLTCCLD